MSRKVRHEFTDPEDCSVCSETCCDNPHLCKGEYADDPNWCLNCNAQCKDD